LLAVDPGEPAVLTMDPQIRRASVFDAMKQLILKAAEVRTLVVVFEDLHWTDTATEQWLQVALDSIPTARVLTILTYRHGYSPPFGDRTYHKRLMPSPLSPQDSARMAESALAARVLPPGLSDAILRKAEGNPFFLEEVAKSIRELDLLARPVSNVVVPDRVQ